MDIKTIFSQPNLTLIDVRESFEFFFGHAKGATNIPLGSIPAKIKEIEAMPKPIIVYCQSGNRSGQALRLLQENGVTEVYNGGGIAQVKQHLLSSVS